MNDLQLINLVAATDRYPTTSPLPGEIAGVDEAFANVIDRLEAESTTRTRPGRLAEGTRRPRPGMRLRRGVLVAAAAFVVVMIVGAALILLAPGSTDVVESTTIPPTTTTTTTSTTEAPLTRGSPEEEVALAEAAIAAWYADDFESVSRLLDMPGDSMHGGWTAEDFRTQMAYDKTVGTRVGGLECSTPPESGGWFRCTLELHNAMTDAMDLTADERPTGDVLMSVVDGRLSRYEFQSHEFLTESYGLYLALAGELSGFEGCLTGPPLSLECARIQLEHLDEWVNWNRTTSAEELARAHLDVMFNGGCNAIKVMTVNYHATVCDPAVQYEAVLGGVLDVTNCLHDVPIVRCDGLYSNALNHAVGAPAVSVQVAVQVGVRPFGMWDATQFEGSHPQDGQLLLSVRSWAQEAGLGDEVEEQCGFATARKTPECATFIIDNLDAWATWYPLGN